MDKLDTKHNLEPINDVFETTVLSDDPHVLESEIKSYQEKLGFGIFEIGRRLIKFKENDFAHGEWMKWLEKMNIDINFAQRSMKIVKRFGNSNTAMSPYLESKSISILSELVTLPDEILNETFALAEGEEEKSPMEMSVREVRDLKRQLKESQQCNQELEQRPPKVVEKVPADYEPTKQGNQRLKQDNQRLNQLYNRAKQGALNQEARWKEREKELEAEIEEQKRPQKEAEELARELQNVRKQIRNANDAVVAIEDLEKVSKKAQDFLLEIAPLIYSQAVERLDPESLAAKHYADVANQILDVGNHLIAHIPVGENGKRKPRPVQMVNENVIEGKVEN